MPHTDDAGVCFHHFTQRMRLDSGFDTGILFHLLRRTAVIGDLLAFFYHHLIAATAQSQIDRSMGIFVILRIGGGRCPKPDTQCHGDLVSDFDGLHIFENVELILLHLRQETVFEHHEVLVVLDLADKRIRLAKIFIYAPVHERDQHGLLHILHAL